MRKQGNVSNIFVVFSQKARLQMQQVRFSYPSLRLVFNLWPVQPALHTFLLSEYVCVVYRRHLGFQRESKFVIFTTIFFVHFLYSFHGPSFLVLTNPVWRLKRLIDLFSTWLVLREFHFYILVKGDCRRIPVTKRVLHRKSFSFLSHALNVIKMVLMVSYCQL